ncbi:glycosyltransferase, partial [Bacteroides fragilis]|nr:glycosyltransferase [Bacteroides fragilis]
GYSFGLRDSVIPGQTGVLVDTEKEFVRAVRELAADANLRRQLDYKHALLALADVHLMPSRKEGWGLAVMEAAQHGVPTVGYSFGLRDSVIPGQTGVLVDTEKEFVRAVREL